ncbi:undecaprenyl diphosphate synthase family protein, partial [Klebsiella pneumoniae]
EVSALMDLFFKALRREAKRLNENNISLRIIGDRSRFHPELQAAMREAEACFPVQGTHYRQARVQPLAGSTGRAGHPPVH